LISLPFCSIHSLQASLRTHFGVWRAFLSFHIHLCIFTLHHLLLTKIIHISIIKFYFYILLHMCAHSHTYMYICIIIPFWMWITSWESWFTLDHAQGIHLFFREFSGELEWFWCYGHPYTCGCPDIAFDIRTSQCILGCPDIACMFGHPARCPDIPDSTSLHWDVRTSSAMSGHLGHFISFIKRSRRFSFSIFQISLVSLSWKSKSPHTLAPDPALSSGWNLLKLNLKVKSHF